MSSASKIRRLLHLLEHLQSGRRYHAGQLADFLRVSKRTVFRDLRILQEAGIQLLYDETEQGYWLPPSTFLPPTDLTVGETLSLLLLGDKLGHPRAGIPFQGAARDAAMKLLANLPESIRSHVSDLSQRMQISLEPKHAASHTQTSQSQAHYEAILQALQHRKKIRIKYHSLQEQASITTLLSPYEIFFQNRSWYAIGRSSFHRKVRTFHIWRILATTPTNDSYEIPPRFSLQKHFGNAWRMIREKPEVEVVVRFQPLVAKNVEEVLWHPTQRIVWNPDGSLIFHANVAGIREISWWILGYGSQAEVLAPRSLRELIIAHVKQLAAVYHTPTDEKPSPAIRKARARRAPAI